MASSVNAKTITLISLFVGLFKYRNEKQVTGDTPKPLNTATSNLGFIWDQDRTATGLEQNLNING